MRENTRSVDAPKALARNFVAIHETVTMSPQRTVKFRDPPESVLPWVLEFTSMSVKNVVEIGKNQCYHVVESIPRAFPI